jgi:dTMP kinase
MDEWTNDQTAVSGRFIVVEGIDGAGTTTMVEELVKHERAARRAVHRTCQPSTGPIGAMIRQFLSRRLIVPTEFGPSPPGWATMALLFASDRLDHLEAEVLPLLRDGVTVICDRYDLSSLAYQSVTSSAENQADAARVVQWIREINRHARRPDLTIILDVDPERAAQRRRQRGGGRDLYEDPELQVRLADAYAHAERLLPNDRLVHVDGNRSVEEVLAGAAAAIAELERT